MSLCFLILNQSIGIKIMTLQSPNDFDQAGKTSHMQRFLFCVEWLGNLLPHPVVLFIWMSVILLGLSAILSAMDVAVIDPRPEGAKGRAEDGMIGYRAGGLTGCGYC